MTPLAIGCEHEVTCQEACERANACPDRTQLNCADHCAKANALNQPSSCQNFYQALLACSMKQPNPCTAKEASCSKPAFEYGRCLARYCKQVPMPKACLE